MIKYALKHAYRVGFRDGEMEAKEDALNPRFMGLNKAETLKLCGLGLHQLPHYGHRLSRSDGHSKTCA